jgi:hypothetical protein
MSRQQIVAIGVRALMTKCCNVANLIKAALLNASVCQEMIRKAIQLTAKVFPRARVTLESHVVISLKTLLLTTFI